MCLGSSVAANIHLLWLIDKDKRLLNWYQRHVGNLSLMNLKLLWKGFLIILLAFVKKKVERGRCQGWIYVSDPLGFYVDDTDFLLRDTHEFFDVFYVWLVEFCSSIGRDQLLFSMHFLKPVPNCTDQSNLCLAEAGDSFKSGTDKRSWKGCLLFLLTNTYLSCSSQRSSRCHPVVVPLPVLLLSPPTLLLFQISVEDQYVQFLN